MYLIIYLTGSWQIRWNSKSSFRRWPQILATQTITAGLVVLFIARTIKSQFESYDPSGHWRYIRRRERYQIKKRRCNGIVGHSAKNSSSSGGVQIQFGVFREVFSSRDSGGEFGGRHAFGERRQVWQNRILVT